MEALAAIGLASNIIGFVEFAGKVLKGAIDIRNSDTSGTDVSIDQMKGFAAKLQTAVPASHMTEEDQELCDLAKQCQTLASEIISLNEQIHGPVPAAGTKKSIIRSLKVSWKASRREKDIYALNQRLDSCRGQLHLQIDYLTRTETAKRLDGLVERTKEHAEGLEKLFRQADSLAETQLRGAAVASLSAEAQAQLQELLAMPKHTCRLIVQHRVLKTLWFEDMDQRYESVDSAHEKTFRWILKGDAGSDDEEESFERKTTRDMFLSWLASGNGIFHVSGKMGSGKSTLMKYLYEDEVTVDMLKAWAGDRKLVFASFFFWKPGSKLQKSLDGLFRSLLYSILQSCPSLIEQTLSDLWTQVKASPWQVGSQAHLSNKAIRTAFSQLIRSPDVHQNRCFCFFIDGLDEYEETTRDDAKSLVDLLCSWTAAAPDSVKLCVSSREHNVFMNAFDSEKRFRLQDLTMPDMTSYVLDKLGHMDHEEDRKRLTEEIVKNADGIFFWVTLVVRRVREQIENGCAVDDLVEEISSLPKELDDLFSRILGSLEDRDLKRAYQTFSLLTMPKSRVTSLFLTTLMYSLLEDYARDPNFALKDDFQRQEVMNEEERRRRCLLGQKKLQGWCRGLVEHIPARQSKMDLPDGIIRLTHRSVPEFLAREEQQNHMKALLGGFDAVNAFSQLGLAAIWLSTPTLIAHEMSKHYNRLTAGLVAMRWESSLDQEPYTFLESLDQAWARHRDKGHIGTAPGQINGVDPYNDVTWWILGIICPSGQPRYVQAPIYFAAIQGNWSYVLWKLSRLTEPLSAADFACLVSCMLIGDESPLSMDNLGLETTDIVHAIFDRANISMDAPTNFWFLRVASIRKHAIGSRLLAPEESSYMTLSQHIFLYCFWKIYYAEDSFLARIGAVLESILLRGVDPRFWVSVSPKRDASATNEVSLRMMNGRTECCVVFDTDFWGSTDNLEAKEISVADMVRSRPLNNQARLLELIDQNMRRIEAELEAEER